jgi:hypothetical protein
VAAVVCPAAVVVVAGVLAAAAVPEVALPPTRLVVARAGVFPPATGAICTVSKSVRARL